MSNKYKYNWCDKWTRWNPNQINDRRAIHKRAKLHRRNRVDADRPQRYNSGNTSLSILGAILSDSEIEASDHNVSRPRRPVAITGRHDDTARGAKITTNGWDELFRARYVRVIRAADCDSEDREYNAHARTELVLVAAAFRASSSSSSWPPIYCPCPPLLWS